MFLVIWGEMAGQAPEAFRDLALPVDSFREDPLRREQILNLVKVWSADSVLIKAKQRHKIPLAGGLGSLMGANWRYIKGHKTKYIGTNSRPLKVFKGIAGEIDLNIFLTPHLPPYVSLLLQAFEDKEPKPRKMRHWRSDLPPYPCVEELKLEGGGYLTVECECTPVHALREELQQDFLPTHPGAYSLQEHPNFGLPYPSMGVYGVWCFDCNHSCRPEVHPFDWIWWNDFTPENHRYIPGARIWFFAGMRDATRRFDDWSPEPLRGAIALPFYLPPGKQRLSIYMHVISQDSCREEALPAHDNFLEETLPVKFNSQNLLEVPGRTNPFVFRSNRDLPEGAARVRVLDHQHDPQTGESWGWIELRLAVDNLFAAKMTLWPVN